MLKTDYIGGSHSIEVNASADEVCRLLLDVESHPKLFRTCLRVENLTPHLSLSPCETGVKIRYKRVSIEGKIYRYTTRVTVRDDARRYYSMCTTFMNCTSTKSYQVTETGANSCRVTVAYALVPDGICGKAAIWMNRKRLSSGELGKTVELGLQDIKHWAENGTCLKDSEWVMQNMRLLDTGSGEHLDSTEIAESI